MYTAAAAAADFESPFRFQSIGHRRVPYFGCLVTVQTSRQVKSGRVRTYRRMVRFPNTIKVRVMMNKELNEEALQELYAWIDKIKLSRPKRNISRDFSDGGNSAMLLLAHANIYLYVSTRVTKYIVFDDEM